MGFAGGHQTPRPLIQERPDGGEFPPQFGGRSHAPESYSLPQRLATFIYYRRLTERPHKKVSGDCVIPMRPKPEFLRASLVESSPREEAEIASYFEWQSSNDPQGPATVQHLELVKSCPFGKGAQAKVFWPRGARGAARSPAAALSRADRFRCRSWRACRGTSTASSSP